jgi:hypothetical protein
MGIEYTDRPFCAILNHRRNPGPPAVALILAPFNGGSWYACCSGCLTDLYHLAAALGDAYPIHVFRLPDFNHLDPSDPAQHPNVRQRSHPNNGR